MELARGFIAAEWETESSQAHTITVTFRRRLGRPWKAYRVVPVVEETACLLPFDDRSGFDILKAATRRRSKRKEAPVALVCQDEGPT